MPIPENVRALVERFERNIDAYKHGQYNETQVRREFIDPLFESLGWDVANVQGYAEAYKDVVHEDAIKVGQATKAPDYSFRIGGVRKFFVEAKKPAIHIKEDIHPAYQLRRYAWSAKLPLSIVTDFEELAVYDCRIKPEKTDPAAKARLLYLTYAEYAPRWDELASVFSREAILKGAFDKYAAAHKDKRGTAEVDVVFLQEIERWRGLLARNLALRNPALTRRELNFAVQRTIDRIIFLRICEDRGIEAYGRLLALQDSPQVYARLRQLFYQADDRYNSGIFHFKTERGHPEPPDRLTPNLQLDDQVLQAILRNLYYPDSPYEFAVIPAEILGQVYEQFLGKVIRLTAGHQAKVEEKPEVKKAGGVYYTPAYIVEYIVKHTVGELLTDKALSWFETLTGLELTILDPACGSGSFLIGAYQYLLDWHRDQYLREPQKWSKGRQPRLYRVSEHDWKLTIAERKRILLSHIYGVDIDAQAVETTKLSLLLKVLEGENEQTISSQMALFQERVLPDLANNIKCGNSLIGSDFYEGKQLTLLDEEEMYRVNVFDWDKEFPEIMQKGGFDAVIGNPPYLKLTLNNLARNVAEYYHNQYQSLGGGSSKNLFQLFIEKMLELQPKMFSFIVPEALLTTSSNQLMRAMMRQRMNLSTLVVFDHFVFKDATIGSTIFILARDRQIDNITVEKLYATGGTELIKTLAPKDCLDVWESSSKNEFQQIIDKIKQHSIFLGELVTMAKGMVVKDRKNYLHDAPRSTDLPFLLGNLLSRYQIRYEYFGDYREFTIIGGTKDLAKHLRIPRILIRRTGNILCAAYSSQPELIESTVYIVTSGQVNLKYLLAILNSRVLTFYLQQKLLTNIQGFPQVLMGQLAQLPIHTIDFANPTDKVSYDKMVELVERMLDLHKQFAEANIPQAHTMLQRQIEATDQQIDRLVYELYGLTEEEIALVEGI